MTEAEWLAGTNPRAMLESMRGRASGRRLRLFAAACCRRVWDLLGDVRSRRAVEVAEQHADGLATADELEAASAGANAAYAAYREIEDTTIEEYAAEVA